MPVYIRKQQKVRGWICPQRYSYRSNSHSRSSLTIDSTVFPSGKNSTTRPNAADGTAFNSCVPWKPQCVLKQCKKLLCLFFVMTGYMFFSCTDVQWDVRKWARIMRGVYLHIRKRLISESHWFPPVTVTDTYTPANLENPSRGGLLEDLPLPWLTL